MTKEKPTDARGVINANFTGRTSKVKNIGKMAKAWWSGATIEKQVKYLIEDFDRIARFGASVEGSSVYSEWLNNYNSLVGSLTDFILNDNMTALKDFYKGFYNGNELPDFKKSSFIYLLRSMRNVLEEEFYRPVFTDSRLKGDELRLHLYNVTLHADILGNLERPSRVSLELLEGIDPVFNVKLDTRNYGYLEKNYALAINPVVLEKLVEASPDVNEDLGYRSCLPIENGDMIPIRYKLDFAPGGDREMLGMGYLAME